MKTQVKPANGRSFWNFTGVIWEDVTCGKPILSEHPWIRWGGHTWHCKRSNRSICEIAGYQIAETLGLPVQPWMAFFQDEKLSNYSPRGTVGILVKRWDRYAGEVCLGDPAGIHPDWVGQALALAIFDRFEWPWWLVSEHQAELRIFDLEGIGPNLRWPPQRTGFRHYLKTTLEALSEVRGAALAAGVHRCVETNLHNLSTKDFSQILDFSGHPHAYVMKTFILRGLEARQDQLRHLLGIDEPVTLLTR